MDFLSAILRRDLVGIYFVCIIVGSSGQMMVRPQEDRITGVHGSLLRGKTLEFGARLWHIVLHLQPKFELLLATQRQNKLLEIGYFKNSSESGALKHAFHWLQATTVCNAGSGLKTKLVGGRSTDLRCILMKAGSVLVPVMAMCWSKAKEGNAFNQIICGPDIKDLHLESWSGSNFLWPQEQSRGYPKHTDSKFVRRQSVNSTCSVDIHEQLSLMFSKITLTFLPLLECNIF